MNDFPWRRVWALAAYFVLAAIPLAWISLRDFGGPPFERTLRITGLIGSAGIAGAAIGLILRRRWAWVLAASFLSLVGLLTFAGLALVLVSGGTVKEIASGALGCAYVMPALLCVVSCREAYDRSTRG